LLGVLFLDVPKNSPQYPLVAAAPLQRLIQQPIEDSVHFAPLDKNTPVNSLSPLWVPWVSSGVVS
jgi:hypothetical protein